MSDLTPEKTILKFAEPLRVPEPCRITAEVRLGDDSLYLTVEGPTPEAVIAMYKEASQ